MFRFYLARQQYKEASKTAMIIATEEQNAGKEPLLLILLPAYHIILHLYYVLSHSKEILAYLSGTFLIQGKFGIVLRNLSNSEGILAYLLGTFLIQREL